MEISRLIELKKGSRSPEPVELKATSKGKGEKNAVDPKAQQTALQQHMKLYDDIKEALVVLKKNTELVENLKEKERSAVQEKARKEIMDELDKAMQQTSTLGVKVKNQLEKIKVDNDTFKAKKENAGSATAQMRENLYQTHVRRFHHQMNTFNQASQDFKNTLKDRTRRQLKIIKSDLSEEKVEEIVESENADEIIAQALDEIPEDLDQVVAQIEERHQGILKLEHQVLQIHELFRDLATLVDLQQETMDIIEQRIGSAKDFTEKAIEDLKKGEDLAKKSKKKQICILICVVIVLLVIIFPILLTASNF